MNASLSHVLFLQNNVFALLFCGEIPVSRDQVIDDEVLRGGTLSDCGIASKPKPSMRADLPNTGKDTVLDKELIILKRSSFDC